MTTSETSMQLESIVDGYSLAEVLEALRDICDGKADHLRSNWQDNASAKEWERASNALCTAISKVTACGIPQPRMKAGAQ